MCVLVVLVRSILLYLIIIFALRMMGKRQIGELQPSELVTTILISNIAAIPIEDTSIPMSMAVTPILTLAALEVILSAAEIRSRRLRTILSGKPQILNQNGVLDQQMMRRLRISIDDLMESLHGNGVFDLQEVQFAVIETNGKLSVCKKQFAQPMTMGAAGKADTPCNPPTVVISDGVILPPGLQVSGISRQTLGQILQKHHCTADEVFLLTVDGNGESVLILKQNAGEKR